MNRFVPVVLLVLVVHLTTPYLSQCSALDGSPSPGSPVILAQGGWKAEYEAVCSKTDVAMTLSSEDLRALIVRCDKLKPQIEAEEESTRKVYLRRLKMCRELFQYVLDSKEIKR